MRARNPGKSPRPPEDASGSKSCVDWGLMRQAKPAQMRRVLSAEHQRTQVRPMSLLIEDLRRRVQEKRAS